MFAPSQWEMALFCNDVSHWLGADLESALYNSCHLLYAGNGDTADFCKAFDTICNA